MREQHGNAVAEFLEQTLYYTAVVYIVVEELENILFRAEHIAVGNILPRGKLQHEQLFVILRNGEDTLLDLARALLERIVFDTRTVVCDVLIGHGNEECGKLLINEIHAVRAHKARQLVGGEVVVLAHQHLSRVALGSRNSVGYKVSEPVSLGMQKIRHTLAIFK